MKVMSALDCDYFSDSYSSVFRQCSGYQAPFPIVRLGRANKSNFSAVTTDEVISHPCLALPPKECNCCSTSNQSKCSCKSEAYLLHLRLDVASLPSCVSFLELMCSEGSCSPVRISSHPKDPPWMYFKELEEKGRLITTVRSSITSSRAGNTINDCLGARGTSGIFWKYNEEKNHWVSSVFPTILSVALTGDGGAWCLSGTGGYPKKEGHGLGSSGDEALVMRFDHPSLFSATSRPFYSQKVFCSAEASALGVEEMDSCTAAVFTENGITLVDTRERPSESSKEPFLNFLPHGGMWSASLASDQLVIGYSKRQKILVFDYRKPSIPINSLESPIVLGIRSQINEHHALLLGGEQVAILSFSPFSVIGSVQVPGVDNVMDAVLTSTSSTLTKLRVSTVCGMVYDWSVSH